MSPKNERFELRLDEELLDRVDRWRADQGDVPSRSEAVRRLVEVGLATDRKFAPQFSDGERLLLSMVGELLKQTKQQEFNVEFVNEALYGGHEWALAWDMQGVFHNHHDTRAEVREVAATLDMWMFIERAFEKLPDAEKRRVLKEADVVGEKPQFMGFDGNNEATLMSIARMFIHRMGRWEMFKERPLNSHFPIRGRYRAMVAKFEPMRESLSGMDLGAQQLIDILKREHRG